MQQAQHHDPLSVRHDLAGILKAQRGRTASCRLMQRSGRIVARFAVGEGFPFPLFRLRGGVTVSPWRSFPRSPLRFRKAGFPRYGSKAGLSDRAFPDHASVKLAPGIPVAILRFASILRAPAAAWIPRSKSGPPARWSTAMRATCVALLHGPSLRFGLCYPEPSTLNRPDPPHSRAHRNFTSSAYMRCLRCAGAPRRPTSGSGLLLHIPSAE